MAKLILNITNYRPVLRKLVGLHWRASRQAFSSKIYMVALFLNQKFRKYPIRKEIDLQRIIESVLNMAKVWFKVRQQRALDTGNMMAAYFKNDDNFRAIKPEDDPLSYGKRFLVKRHPFYARLRCAFCLFGRMPRTWNACFQWWVEWSPKFGKG